MAISQFYVGVGANLTPEGYANPRAGCEAALASLADYDIHITRLSNWYESAPVPLSDQPWYLNAVAVGKTPHDAVDTLAILHQKEADFGRVRGVRNAARVLDLDLLDFAGTVNQSESLTLPHPRMDQRAFVLLPLKELAPDWRHPVSKKMIDALISDMPAGQEIRVAPPI